MTAEQPDVWVFANGDRIIHRGPLVECAEAWGKADGLDKWHGSIRYESGPLTYDQQADKLFGVMEYMEDPTSGWREPPDFEPMREAVRQLGAAMAATIDAVILDTFKSP